MNYLQYFLNTLYWHNSSVHAIQKKENFFFLVEITEPFLLSNPKYHPLFLMEDPVKFVTMFHLQQDTLSNTHVTSNVRDMFDMTEKGKVEMKNKKKKVLWSLLVQTMKDILNF